MAFAQPGSKRRHDPEPIDGDAHVHVIADDNENDDTSNSVDVVLSTDDTSSTAADEPVQPNKKQRIDQSGTDDIIMLD